MTGLSTFINPPVTIDASDAMQSESARASFGWDYPQWGRVSDEDVSAMASVRDGDFNRLYPQRVVVVDAISNFCRLLSSNPLYSPILARAFGANPFPAAASMILRPSSAPASLAGSYYLDKFAGRRVVAVHLRTIEYMSPEEVSSLFPPRRALKFDSIRFDSVPSLTRMHPAGRHRASLRPIPRWRRGHFRRLGHQRGHAGRLQDPRIRRISLVRDRRAWPKWGGRAHGRVCLFAPQPKLPNRFLPTSCPSSQISPAPPLPCPSIRSPTPVLQVVGPVPR